MCYVASMYENSIAACDATLVACCTYLERIACLGEPMSSPAKQCMSRQNMPVAHFAAEQLIKALDFLLDWLDGWMA